MTDTMLDPEIHALKFDPSIGSYLVAWHKYLALANYAFEVSKALTGLTVGGSEFFSGEDHGFFKADIPACTKNINWRIEQARKMGAAQASARDAETIKAAEALADGAEDFINGDIMAERLEQYIAAFRATQEARK